MAAIAVLVDPVVIVFGVTETTGGTDLVDIGLGMVVPLPLMIVLANASGASLCRGASVSTVELQSTLDGRFGAFASR